MIRKVAPLHARSGRRIGRARASLALGLLVVAASCLSLPTPSDGLTRESVTWKAVMRKQEPNLLISADGTRCEVSSTRFEEVREGQNVLCHWR